MARTMLTTKRKASVSTSERPKKRAAVALSSDGRPAKWTRGGQGKKAEQDENVKQDRKVGQPLRYPVRVPCLQLYR